MRGNAGLLSSHCRRIGPHLALRGNLVVFSSCVNEAYVPLELQTDLTEPLRYYRDFNSVRAVRGNTRLLLRHCRAIGPHLALKGESLRFLELQGSLSSSPVVSETSGNLSWCLSEVSCLLSRCGGMLGFLSSRCLGIWAHLKLRWNTQWSSPVVTGISGFLSSVNMGVRPWTRFETWDGAFLLSCKK